MPEAYTVYKHTGPTGKVYIGITRQKPETRWRNGEGYRHCPHFYAAIKRHGWAAFHHELLAEGLTRSEAEQMEVHLIERHRATDPRHGYNIERGGTSGAKHSDLTRQKIADANRVRVWSDVSRGKLRAHQTGSRASDLTRAKMSQAQRGRRHPPETIEKMRAAQQMVPVRDVSTGQHYRSVMEAARATGCDPSRIVAVCKGKRSHTHGHVWAYEVTP